ncbi:MAG TPA: hypothetical protein PK340_06240 [Bacilli bacterium]|nr:hypothetical protein [Bacilli bacterium]
MGNDDLAIRFSNEMYATRSEVSKALGTSLIDTIWTNIIKYRGQFTRYLSLRQIDHGQLSLVLTPSISESLNAIERKLVKAMLKLGKISKTSSTYAQYEQDFFARQLDFVAQKYRLGVNESFLKSIVNDTVSTISPDRMVLVNYYAAIKYLKNHQNDPIDEAFFADIYALLSGQDDLATLYRQHEIASYEQKALIGKTYAAAPIARIEEMMGQLQDFIVHADFSPLVKAVTVFYYMVLIKPFETYSEEMALLTMKHILVHADFDEIPLLMNFEEWLLDPREELARVNNEVQKSGDVTYLLASFIPMANNAIERILDGAINLEKEVLKDEVRTDQTPSNINVEDEHKPQSEQILAPTPNKPLQLDERMALPGVPVALDEVDAARIEEHLMETNPALKRGEAYFYARHCTIGKFYTISQFKKTLGCAYETARTSMDHLASLGYYRKESYKNKFIYTPIGRK